MDDSTPRKKTSVQTTSRTNVLSSFLTPDILQHLCRELNHDKIEAEFSIKVSIYIDLNRYFSNSYSKSRLSSNAQINWIISETNRFRGSTANKRRYLFEFTRNSSNQCQCVDAKHSSIILSSNGAIRIT